MAVNGNEAKFVDTNEEKSKESVDTKDEEKIKVKVLLFARARELAGVSEIDLLLPKNSHTLSCVEELLEKFPSLEIIINCSAVALNCNYVTCPIGLTDGDEVAIIPPISGG